MENRVAGAQGANPFSAGSMVYLRNQPGPWGTVLGTHDGRVIVRWSSLNCVRKHLANSLILASGPEDYEDDRENQGEPEDQEEQE